MLTEQQKHQKLIDNQFTSVQDLVSKRVNLEGTKPLFAKIENFTAPVNSWKNLLATFLRLLSTMIPNMQVALITSNDPRIQRLLTPKKQQSMVTIKSGFVVNTNLSANDTARAIVAVENALQIQAPHSLSVMTVKPKQNKK